MKKTVFKGSAVAIITPFTENGVNFDELGRLIEYHIENSTDAIVICGTTGEASTLSHEEHIEDKKYSYCSHCGAEIIGRKCFDEGYCKHSS